MIFNVRVQQGKMCSSFDRKKCAFFEGCFNRCIEMSNKNLETNESTNCIVQNSKTIKNPDVFCFCFLILNTSTSNIPTSRLCSQLVDLCVCCQNKFILDINHCEFMSTVRCTCNELCILSFINNGKYFDKLPV